MVERELDVEDEVRLDTETGFERVAAGVCRVLVEGRLLFLVVGFVVDAAAPVAVVVVVVVLDDGLRLWRNNNNVCWRSNG